MPMSYRDLHREYLRYVESNKTFFLVSSQEYFSTLETSSAKIQGETIKSYFHPYILSGDEYGAIERTTNIMAEIIAKVGDLFFRKEEIREAFGFSEELLDLMHVDPGYDMFLPIGRFDGYFIPEKRLLRFCEFNADGTSGMNETNTMDEAFLATSLGAGFSQLFSLSNCELRTTLLDVLLTCCRKFYGNTEKIPQTAIIDFTDKATTAEFAALKAVFTTAGVPAEICDIRDLHFKDGRLYFREFQLDLAYRRVVTGDLLERSDTVVDFLRAYKRKSVCTVGSFRTEVAHSKLIFCILTNNRYGKFFSPAERKFIATHLPWTRKLTSSDPDLEKVVLHNRHSLVLKPYNSYGSRGIVVGSICEQKEWEANLSKVMDSNYLVQEKLAIPKKEFITGPNGETEELKINTSSFMYGGKLAGFYTRVSPHDVITTSLDGAVLPTLVEDA